MPGHSPRKANPTPVPGSHQGCWQKWLGFELHNSHFDTCCFEADDPRPRQVKSYQIGGLFDLAMRCLKERPDLSRPLACILSVEPPETPIAYEEQHWQDREVWLPPGFRADGEVQRRRYLEQRRLYYAMVENLDWTLDAGTVAVFLSDHGEMRAGFAHTCQAIPV